MPISQLGAINTTALIVPDLYVQIVPPTITLLNGVPTNVLGVVGTASWGPVNSPTIVSGMASYAQKFGAIQNRKYDLGTAVAAAVLQGASNFRCVRVTDGTDTAASVVVLTNCITFTGKYTGTLGNGLSVTLAAGSAASTTKATVSLAGFAPEVYDNIGGSGNAFWVNLANAINLGANALRGPSQFIIATAGAGVTAPTLTAYALTGGTDGVATITASTLIGVDTVPRKGMYALRGTGASIAMLADADDSTQWTTQVSYGLSEGTYMIMVGPAGDTISNAVSVKATAGIDSYAAKLLFGDWVLFNDNVNGVQRLISPQGFVAGLLANLAPQGSSLNKPLYGIVGTQKSIANQNYSSAELQLLGQAGIDIIANPVPGGSYFGARFGHNTSSNAVINGDNYTRMTNYIASTINAGMGLYIGKLQTPSVRLQAKATLDNFFSAMLQQGQIGTADGSDAFSVVLDNSNNPPARVALGYMQADVKVTYFSIIEKFLINLEGGQSVQVTRQLTTPVAA
jgi:uncharacterized protein